MNAMNSPVRAARTAAAVVQIALRGEPFRQMSVDKVLLGEWMRMEHQARGMWLVMGQAFGPTLHATRMVRVWRDEFARESLPLNAVEMRQLEKLLAREKQGQDLVLGWLLTSERGKVALGPAAEELHHRCFALGWQRVFVLRCSVQKQNTVFLFWEKEAGAGLEMEVEHHLPLPLRREWRPKDRVGFRPWARRIAPLRTWAKVGALAALLVAGTVGVLQWQAQEKQVRGASLNLTARWQEGAVELLWNPDPVPGRSRASAYLLVGGERVNLSESEFRRGSIRLPFNMPQDRDIAVRFVAGEWEDSTALLKKNR
ncbi:MAG: hypothetical protein NW208_17220 [Bryobacter sp.]|nr:hypothetical protein [Bryobacter sp.]